jgi:tetratricopeptide (TPR) repeat protein
LERAVPGKEECGERIFGLNRRIFRIWIWTLILGSLALCGCESQGEEQANQAVVAYYEGDYGQAHALLDPLAKQTNGDFVLNNARLGSTDLADYRLDSAEDAFLRAYEVINSVGVNDGGRSLGAVLVAENIKVWKGEPFERAMVNFYLGMIYYMRHDYNNARAAFENALFKLRDYDASDQNKYTDVDSNFALGYLMLAKSWQRLGETDKAQALFDRVRQLRPDLAYLADAKMNEEANLLLIVDWGEGPRKVTNRDGTFVGFAPSPRQAGPIFLPRVLVDGANYETGSFALPPVDFLALAQDRKWESIDTIRAIKSVAGTGLMIAGAAESFSNRQSNEELGLALLAGGLLLKATSQADIRQWEMLPRTVFVIPLHVAPGAHTVTVEFSGGWRQTWVGLIAPAEGDDTYYFHSWPWVEDVRHWPPAALSEQNGAAASGAQTN